MNAVPQPGLFALGAPENCYLEIDLNDKTKLKSLIAQILNVTDAFGTVGGVSAVLAVRPSLWREIAPESCPADAADFATPIVGPDGFTMPATQHDVWVWIAGADRASVFDATKQIHLQVDGLGEVVAETTGWHYKESRDLTGFIDGTENPSLIEAAQVACVPDGQPGAGASVLLYQKWEHDITRWEKLAEGVQEKVIGRTKADSIELPEDQQPPTSHVSRTVVEEDGEELDIFRRNVAYGSAGSHGTLFVGFSQDQHRQYVMLERMAGVGDGVRDSLTRFTTPLSGGFYVVPAASDLASYLEEED